MGRLRSEIQLFNEDIHDMIKIIPYSRSSDNLRADRCPTLIAYYPSEIFSGRAISPHLFSNNTTAAPSAVLLPD